MRMNLQIITTLAIAVMFASVLPLQAEEATRGSEPDASSSAAGTAAAPIAWHAPMMEPMPGSGEHHTYTPKAELFLGYSYLRAVPTLASGNRFVWLHGGSTSIAFNFNRYIGIVGDFGGFADSELRLKGIGPNDGTIVHSTGRAYTYLAGPRISFRSHERITPFIQALFGGVHASTVTITAGCTDVGCVPLPSENRFAMTAGGGLDLRVRRHFALRLVQAEYLMTRFEDRATGKTAMQNDVRLSTGIVLRFGGSRPAVEQPGVTYSCAVSPAAVFPGGAITVTGTPLNLNPKNTATYTWAADGATVSGTTSTGTIETTSLAPGSYIVRGHVSEGSRPGENADCTASFTVKAFEPPSVSCSANPTTIKPGDTSTITATGVSPQERPLTYSYSATSGSIAGTGAGTGPTATLSTTGASAGPITVTCSVADDKGLTASAPTSVTVVAPVVAPKPVVSALCSLHFDRDVRRPSRVNNEAKACLDDIALTMQRSSDSKLALVGDSEAKEKGGKKLAAERALNTKAYLVKDKGVDAARITVYTGTQDAQSVTTVLVPEGADFDTAGKTPVDESSADIHGTDHMQHHKQ